MSTLPTGTVTFLFTDIEGSTGLAQQFPAELPALLARHHAILQQAIQAHQGHVFQIIGDAFCAAFSTAGDALLTALDAQRGLQYEAWRPAPVKVRMGLHTGSAQAGAIDDGAGGYVGYLTLTRAQRVMSVAHGGQVLLSNPTAELVRGELPADVTLRDMGEHRLKGLVNLEHLWQLVAPDLRQDFPPLPSLNAIPNNLPVQLTSFVGREKDIVEVKRLLSASRLVTLTGAGGAGKTRLSLQVAAEVLDEFAQGVWLVELAALSDPALIPQTAASVLGLREESGRPLIAILADYLHAKTALLILDNCEHLIEGCAQFADAILHAAPQVKILASSREALDIGGEATYRVPSLAAPDPQHLPALDTLTHYDAVKLFIERALAVQPSFHVTNANAPAVAQICYHLDGIPLAIELAAARTRLLSPDQISARLSDRFNLLTGGSRTALPRHQTLRAAMDWSYDLLSEAERTLFNRLAVFAGSFSLEAAESICSNENAGETLEWINHPSQVLDLLGALVDHSLVSVQERNAVTRYILLETVRQYALEKLQASGEWTNLQDRHLVYYVEFAERGSLHVANGEPVWLEQFETEYGNLRVAMEYAIAIHPESAILLENPLGWFCEFSSRRRESYGWAMRILALTEAWPSGKMRAMALWHAGDRMRSVGEHKQGQVLMEAGLEMAKEFGDKYLAKDILEHLTTSIWNDCDWARLPNYANQYLEISRELEDKIGIQISLHLLGEAACGNGDNRTGRMLIEQALELGRQDNHQTLISMTLASLARLARLEKDNASAIALYMESAQVRREMGWRASVPGILINMCQVYLQEGNSEQVRVLTEECLAIYKDLPEILESDLLYCLANFAGAAGNAGQDGRAACLFGAVEAVAEDLGIVMDEFDHAAYDPIIAAVRQRLGEADFNAAWAEGRKMNLEQALEYALAQTTD